jgi:riboflavin kinase/FMN adenylyltransferase
MVGAGKKFIAATGNFDGVHLGHQALLKETADFAAAYGARPGVVLFEPHPRRYFRPDDSPFLLTAPAHRDDLLHAHGAEKIFILKFDKALASLEPEDFVKGVLKEKLDLAGVVAGADFRFGAFRAGDGAALSSLGARFGLEVKIVDLLLEDDAEKYGASGARNALRAGNVKAAAAILGRLWSVRGRVGEDRRMGRVLGFPTANFTLGEVIEPRKGVYATRTRLGDETYPSVSNFGRRPTLADSAPLLETHLFDFDGDLYGRDIEVEFVEFLRDEKKFDGLEDLKIQIAKDCRRARTLLA